MKKMPKISESELEVMRVLWEYDQPMTVTQLRQELDKRLNWEASTTKTLLLRLWNKGAVSRDKADGQSVYYYSPLVSREDYGSESADRLIDKLFGGRAGNLVASLLRSNKLTQEDIAELREIWDDDSKGE